MNSEQENGEPEEWVLMKRGLYYRPNAAGYTSNIEEAGVYTEEEAKKHVYPHDEPVTMHRKPRGEETIASLLRQLESVTKERDELQQHEIATHERLNKVLGQGDSLENLAKQAMDGWNKAIAERDEFQSRLSSEWAVAIQRDEFQRRAEAAEANFIEACTMHDAIAEARQLKGELADLKGAFLAECSDHETTRKELAEERKRTRQMVSEAQALAAKLRSVIRDAIPCMQPCNPQDPELERDGCPPGHRNECGACFARRAMEEALAATPSEALAEIGKSAWCEMSTWAYSRLEFDPWPEWEKSETFRRLSGGGAK